MTLDWANAPTLAVALTKLDLRPGDVVVVKINRTLPAEVMDRLTAYLQQAIPSNKALVLDPIADMPVVIRPEGS